MKLSMFGWSCLCVVFFALGIAAGLHASWITLGARLEEEIRANKACGETTYRQQKDFERLLRAFDSPFVSTKYTPKRKS